MHLVQILLPLRDNDGRPFPRAAFDRVNRELTDRFGGVTAYLRSPASGAWREDGGDVTHDDVAIIESWTLLWTAPGGPPTATTSNTASARTRSSSAPTKSSGCKVRPFRSE